ncbi:hypothetical protein C2845_PM13G19980 [Panicum miliaceum]|uniref:Uncharacterized protein n=1 Tax=Panicum miliaceum TaxID=4540 RepID=A0A3L6RF11_PANMI|nr:hypothetical protein C2845_PM13G19980 [Panicum miliaceum]
MECEVAELVQMVVDLKKNGLTGVGVAANFVLRRMQPLKERAHPAYEYAGADDFVREAPEQIPKEGAYHRLKQFFVPRTSLSTTGCPPPFSLGNPRPESRAAYVSNPPLREHPRSVDLTHRGTRYLHEARRESSPTPDSPGRSDLLPGPTLPPSPAAPEVPVDLKGKSKKAETLSARARRKRVASRPTGVPPIQGRRRVARISDSDSESEGDVATGRLSAGSAIAAVPIWSAPPTGVVAPSGEPGSSSEPRAQPTSGTPSAARPSILRARVRVSEQPAAASDIGEDVGMAVIDLRNLRAFPGGLLALPAPGGSPQRQAGDLPAPPPRSPSPQRRAGDVPVPPASTPSPQRRAGDSTEQREAPLGAGSDSLAAVEPEQGKSSAISTAALPVRTGVGRGAASGSARELAEVLARGMELAKAVGAQIDQ